MNMSIYIENPNQQGFWDKNVSSIFKDIVSLNDNTKQSGLSRLKEYVAEQSQEMPSETFTNFIHDVTQQVRDLLNSVTPHYVISGILALNTLLDIEFDIEDGSLSSQWSIYLRNALHQAETIEVANEGSKVLGRLVRIYQGTLPREFLDFEISEALKWLSSNEPALLKKQIAVLIIAELIKNVPSLISIEQVEAFFDLISYSLKSSDLNLRRGTTDALRWSLRLIRTRAVDIRHDFYHKVYDFVEQGFQDKNSTPEALHGALLALSILFTETGTYMADKFSKVCQVLISLREHKNSIIKRAIIQIIPKLAKFYPEAFALNYLQIWTNFLLQNTKYKKADRAYSLSSLAKMTLELESRIKPQINRIMDMVIDTLQSSMKSKNQERILIPEVFQVISAMAKSGGNHIEPFLKVLLPLLFSTEFSRDMINTLSQIFDSVSSSRMYIQQTLLPILTSILAQESFYNVPSVSSQKVDKYMFSSQKSWRKTFFPAPSHSVSVYTFDSLNNEPVQYDKKDLSDIQNKIILALESLSMFHFDRETTRELIRKFVVNYLEHENVIIRKRAVIACGKLIIQKKESGTDIACIEDVVKNVLHKLLSVALTDENTGIRDVVLNLLDERFDLYLSQNEYLTSLFLLLYDSDYEIRGQAIEILGRLTKYNPSYIYPTMRTVLLELIKQISTPSDNANKKENAAKILGLVIKKFPKLIGPYSECLISLLIETIKNSQTPRLSSHALAALGDLSAACGTEMKNHLDVVMPLIIDAFQDQTSSSKREQALKALIKIIENTGYVIEPLIKYPKLLEIILNKIKREDSGSPLRIELVRLLGIIGSLDPHKYKEIQIDLIESNDKGYSAHDEILKDISKTSEEYYPAIALSTLLKFLRNPHGSQAPLQPLVIQATMTIFKNLGIKCVKYLKYFIPLIKKLLLTCGDNTHGIRELVIQQLSVLVSILKHYTRDYLDDFLDIIVTYWDNPRLTKPIVLFIIEISFALNDEFASCLPVIIPRMLKTLQRDRSYEFQASIQILHAFEIFGEMLDDYLHQIVPSIVQIFTTTDEDDEVNQKTRKEKIRLDMVAIQCLGQLSLNHDLSRFSLMILHNLLKVLDRSIPNLTDTAMETLCNIALNLGQGFKVFIHMFNTAIHKYQIKNGKFNTIVHAIQRGEVLPLPSPPPRLIKSHNESTKNQNQNRFQINSNILRSAWDTSRCFLNTDWVEWIRKLCIALLSESPSPALRSCAPLAKVHPPLTRELFNAGFISCWNELSYELQLELASSIEIALRSNNIPPEILQMLLDLAEFMEHNEKPLPIDTKILASLAVKCHAYAKALHYKEAEFRKGVTTSLFEDIISINYQLQLHEAAQGMLKYAQDTPGVVIKLSWYEKLQRWTAALEAYEQLQEKNPHDLDITVGRMRCLHDLGNWDALSSLSEKVWPIASKGPKKIEVATLALSAALNLYRWESMNKYINALNEHTLDGSFYHAIHAVYNEKFDEALRYIKISRDMAATELTALIGESYSRSYSVVVRIQQLAELEEIVTYKQLKDEDSERKENILRLWKKRLQGVERNVEVWQSLLSVRALVELPRNNVHWWTKFANLVRKSDRPKKARTILTFLLTGQNKALKPEDPIPDTFPMVKYSYLNLLWLNPESRQFAFKEMERWVSQFHLNTTMTSYEKAKCYAKLSRWQLLIYTELNDEIIETIVATAKNAIDKANDWNRAHHVWAIVNYRFVSYYEKNDPNSPKLDVHLLSAISGFIKSIALDPHYNLQDILQLFNLWFKYGAKKDVERLMNEGFDIIAVHKWLHVIPQLMARIHNPLKIVRQGVHKLLVNLGKHHPQALVFPLTVARQSPFQARVTAAQSIMSSIRQHSPQLLDETLLVSSELIRVAILWKEKWYKGLDEASRYYYIEKKTDSMLTVLQKLNEMLEKGAETISEQAFVKAFGRDLQRAWDLIKDFLKTQKLSSINQAWDLYGHVFRTIKRQLANDFDKFHLKNVSPKLLAVSNLQLAVPGTYAVGKDIVGIKGFNPTVKIISSKQQPRKIVIYGDDGLDYPFLLKGHEDLRQDERIMQLFGLVNSFLRRDSSTDKAHLGIQRFAVVPLSTNTGLIEWVPHTDTLHELIKSYRKSHSIALDAEQLIITRFVPRPDISAYYKLTPLQKLEAFEACLEGTSGYDLERIFYLNSKNSEEWLDKRTTYTRSLAVISMVGYILGLGDRHPNNFLLNRNTGKIMHIDFGDCFDVAMQREKFAEKVPFRLTRMLVNAMEVCGIHGTYRFTAEAVMKVLRANAESIIAVLEAFVHDPLINWKLLHAPFFPSSYDDEVGSLIASNMDDLSDDELVGSSSIRDSILSHGESTSDFHDHSNIKAISAMERISNKLNGLGFGKEPLDVKSQIDVLLMEATSNENLCQSYLGWCPYW